MTEEKEMQRASTAGIRVTIGVALGILSCLFGGTASADVVRLEDLEKGAVERRAEVVADAADTAAARADLAGARSPYLPNAALSGELSGSPGARLIRVTDTSGADYLVAGSRPIGEPDAFVPEVRYEGYVSLQQRIYDFGRTRASVYAAESSVTAAEAEERAARASVAEEVRVAYLDWLGAVLLHSASARGLESAKSRLEAVRGRVATGTRPEADLAPARYEETEAELDECEARRNVTSAKLTLEHAAALPLASNAAPDEALLDRQPPTGAAEETPETIALSERSASALATARAYEHDNAPVLTASVRAGVRGQTDNVFPDYRAAISLAVPIWDGGAAAARAAKSREQARALEARADERRAAVNTERKRARADWVNGVERQKLAEALYASAASRKRDAEERYDLGEGTIEAVLEAGAALARAEREVILARVARADAVLRLTNPDGVETK